MKITSVNLIYLSRQMMKELKSELDLVTVLSAKEVESWSGGLEDLTQDLADSFAGLKEPDEETVRGILDSYIVHHPNLFFLYVATEDGKMIMARGVQYAEGVDPRERVWYKDAKAAGHTIFTDPYLSATRGDVVLATAATPIYVGTKMVGVVGADADVNTINEYMNSLEFRDGAYGFLIDCLRLCCSFSIFSFCGFAARRSASPPCSICLLYYIGTGGPVSVITVG